MTTQSETVYTAVSLPLSRIAPGNNDRTEFPRRELEELADSIRKHGLAQPITVRVHPEHPGQYQIVAGERRWRACQLAGLEAIPSIVRILGDEEAAAIMLLENLHRADISPIDEADAYRKRMAQFRWSEMDVAAHAQVSVDRVQRRLKLLTLCPDVQRLVRAGQVPIGHAELMTGLDEFRQVMALKLFEGDHAAPSQKVFRAYCSALLKEQSQQSMFDLTAYYQEKLEALAVPLSKRDLGLKVDPALPVFDMTETCNTGKAIKHYIGQLERGGFHREALAVSTLLDQLVRGNWTTI